MKSRRVTGLLAAAVLIMMSQMALGSYTSIAHDLQNDGIGDTTYTGGVLRISQARDTVTLYVDSVEQTGTVTEASVDMWTYFDHFETGYNPEHPYGTAFFTGGEFILRFKWDYSPDFYELSGPVTGMQIGVASGSMFASTLVGEARWTATTKNLPISTWDDEGGFSSLHALTLYIAQDLRTFSWGGDLGVAGDTMYNVEPNDAAIPEPSAFLLLVLGGVGLLRRRVA